MARIRAPRGNRNIAAKSKTFETKDRRSAKEERTANP
jgi:hypothetical protein